MDGRTDGRTDRQTDGQTEFSSLDRLCIPCSAVIKMCSVSGVHEHEPARHYVFQRHAEFLWTGRSNAMNTFHTRIAESSEVLV